jgi:4-hydroxybenzoate polyprenyltransferase
MIQEDVHMNSKLTTLHAMWITMRPYLLFVSGITGAAGMALSPTSEIVPLLSVFLASFFAYGFGQALTDCFQTDTDALSSPYRPLVAGVVSRKAILILSLAGLTACVAVFSFRNPWNLVIGAAGGAGLATYTAFKRRWWGGPWYNAWIVAVLCLMGYLAASGRMPDAFPPAFLPLLLAVFFGYANFVLSGYFKDIEADASTGYNTIPVVFGRSKAAVVSDVLAVGFLASSTWAAVAVLDASPRRLEHAGAVMFALPGIFTLIVAQIQLHKNRTDNEAYAPILRVVHAYILILSALAALLRPGWVLVLAAHYLLFVFVLSRRPEVSQI